MKRDKKRNKNAILPEDNNQNNIEELRMKDEGIGKTKKISKQKRNSVKKSKKKIENCVIFEEKEETES